MNRTPVAEALEKSGYKKSYIAQKLNISPAYYCFFIKQAEMICTLTGKEMHELDFGTDEQIFFEQ